MAAPRCRWPHGPSRWPAERCRAPPCGDARPGLASLAAARGPHHVGFRLHDADEYQRATALYADRGLEKAMAGFFEGDAGTCRWSYWDSRKSIGCYTELYRLDGPAADAMTRMRAGEVVNLTGDAHVLGPRRTEADRPL